MATLQKISGRLSTNDLDNKLLWILKNFKTISQNNIKKNIKKKQIKMVAKPINYCEDHNCGDGHKK